MSDYIDRQAAIEIIQSMYPGMPRVPAMRKDWEKRYEPYIRMENAIRELPSVQPDLSSYSDKLWHNAYERGRAEVEAEIVRCKDCKWKQGAECVRFADVRPFPDDFCSRAERRKG